MKKAYILGCLFCFAFVGQAQSKYVEMIDEGKYDKAEEKLNKKLVKDPADVELLYGNAYLLSTPAYGKHDTYQAYLTIKRAHDMLSLLDDKQRHKLDKDLINDSTIALLTDRIAAQALDSAMAVNTEAGYQQYIDIYKVNSSYIDKATAMRNHCAYVHDSTLNTEEAYQNFIGKYPDAAEVGAAQSHIIDFEFIKTKQTNTSEAYDLFLKTYPDSKYQTVAQMQHDQLLFLENTTPGDWTSYRNFKDSYTASSWASAAWDSIFHIAMRTRDQEALDYVIKNCSISAYQIDAFKMIHDLVTRDGEKVTLDDFYAKYGGSDDDEENYGDGSEEDTRKTNIVAANAELRALKSRDYELAQMGDNLNLEQPYSSSQQAAYDAYIREAAPNDRAFLALQRMIAPCIIAKNWARAVLIVKSYQPLWRNSPKIIADLISLLQAPWDNTIKANAISAVNTAAGGEYAPVISANNQKLYFCGRGRPDSYSGEDIFISKRAKSGWDKPGLVSALSSYQNDAPLSISTDGNTMAMFRSGQLYYATRDVYGWGNLESFNSNINQGDWQADVTFSSDGKVMIFACVRKDADNYYTDKDVFVRFQQYHGQKGQHQSDIYVSLKDESGDWGEPFNIGPTINTIYCDRSPFLHPDMKTLYFASDGHGGFGDLDIFKSTRLADSCWDCWSEPVNMGKEINTVAGDWAYQVSTDGKVAYFSKKSVKNSEDDLYTIKLPNKLRPDYVATVSGQLTDKNGKPVFAEIKWEDLETGKNVGISKSDPEDGSFFIVLPLGKIYGYYVDQDSFFPIADNIDLRKAHKADSVRKNLDLVSFHDMIKEGTAVPINNLFFNFGKYELLPYSMPELKRVAQIIKKNRLKVEISGHTDSVGTADFNMQLSINRANSVKDYLIQQGCDADLLSAVGYGNTRPVASDATEDGRAKNRRVELRFVKTDGK